MSPESTMADSDPLDDLRAQVRATTEAAERLIGDAVPPRGWSTPAPEETAPFADELQALTSLVSALRELLPPDLREQLNDLLRQLLLVLRALIDWWVSRLDEPVTAGAAPATAGSRGQDIPIA
ncbi:MAG: hypothetical protein JWP17_1968 [Solirubrobacterales bacterium]|nr:hypothetical protein [Solirubrobacterales bacterium]